MYIDAPVANLVRSTAAPGTITVSVSAPGLEPARVTLQSVVAPDDRVAGIEEPPVSDQGRLRITRLSNFQPATVAAKPSRRTTIAEIGKDYDLKPGTRAEVQPQVERFVKEQNPKIDTGTAAYRSFIDRMTTLVIERNGESSCKRIYVTCRCYMDARSQLPFGTTAEYRRIEFFANR